MYVLARTTGHTLQTNKTQSPRSSLQAPKDADYRTVSTSCPAVAGKCAHGEGARGRVKSPTSELQMLPEVRLALAARVPSSHLAKDTPRRDNVLAQPFTYCLQGADTLCLQRSPQPLVLQEVSISCSCRLCFSFSQSSPQPLPTLYHRNPCSQLSGTHGSRAPRAGTQVHAPGTFR